LKSTSPQRLSQSERNKLMSPTKSETSVKSRIQELKEEQEIIDKLESDKSSVSNMENLGNIDIRTLQKLMMSQDVNSNPDFLKDMAQILNKYGKSLQHEHEHEHNEAMQEQDHKEKDEFDDENKKKESLDMQPLDIKSHQDFMEFISSKTSQFNNKIQCTICGQNREN